MTADALGIDDRYRDVAGREHVTPEDKLFKDLNPAERAALDRVFPKSKK
jgi:hypothetical protein